MGIGIHPPSVLFSRRKGTPRRISINLNHFTLFFPIVQGLFPFSEDDQLFRRSCDVDAAVLCQDRHILDTDAEPAGQIDARLRRDHGAHRHQRLVPHIGVGGLVDLDAHAVAVAVAEVFPGLP